MKNLINIAYFDNAATTQPKHFASEYESLWFNSNTPYGTDEQQWLNVAREKIKRCLGVKSGYVLFTRSATESIEWLCKQFVTEECWCSPYEHDSVYNACGEMTITDDEYTYYMMQDYSLYCQQLVNQLTGVVFDIKAEHDKWCTKSNQFFGVDLTAAIGHVPLPKNMDDYCDALWWSGHKFHTEKGIGGLWISDRLFKWLSGSTDPHNQYDLLHGTVNVSGAMAMAEAMMEIVRDSPTFSVQYVALIRELVSQLYINNIHFDWRPNDEETDCDITPAISLIYFPDINADALQQYLMTKNIYIGVAGSACSASHDYRVPNAFGVSDRDAEHCIRVSFCEDNTEEDVHKLVNAIVEFKEKFT